MSKTAQITKAFSLSKNWNFCLEFKLADLWVGAFWSEDDIGLIDIYICVLPCLPIHIRNYNQY